MRFPELGMSMGSEELCPGSPSTPSAQLRRTNGADGYIRRVHPFPQVLREPVHGHAKDKENILLKIAHAVIAAYFLSFSSPAWANDEQELRQAFQAYVHAFAQGDASAGVFEPSGRVVFLKAQPGADRDSITSREFKAIVPRWMASKYPNAAGEIRSLRVISPTMGYVEARLDLGEDDHNDLLVFYKLDGAWRLVAKATEGAR
jgi:hypothetical protein